MTNQNQMPSGGFTQQNVNTQQNNQQLGMEARTPQQKTIEDFDEMMKLLNSSSSADINTIGVNDVNRVAKIVDIKVVQTKYGMKWLFTFEFDNGEKKKAWLSKAFVRDMVSAVGHIKYLIGQLVTFKQTTIFAAGRMVDKIVPILLNTTQQPQPATQQPAPQPTQSPTASQQPTTSQSANPQQ